MKDKDLQEIQPLIEMGRERGIVTADDAANPLPTHLVNTDAMDGLFIMFSGMDMDVIKAVRREREEERRGVPMPEEKRGRDTGAGPARSGDPVRMYLRRMGSVPLLSREGEIEIAKRSASKRASRPSSSTSTPRR